MDNEPEPKKNPPQPAGENEKTQSQEAAAREVAAKALDQAKESVSAGMATFKKLDLQTQVYLVGLAIAFVFPLIFDAISVNVKVEGIASDLWKGNIPHRSITAFESGANGKLAVLAALAGLAVWLWNYFAAKKEAWAPLALAGCAGFSALMFLVLMIRSGNSMPNGLGVKVDVSMTLLGFWVPFAGAAAASFVALKKIIKPA